MNVEFFVYNVFLLLILVYFKISEVNLFCFFFEKLEGESSFRNFGYFRGVFRSKALPRFVSKIFDK